MKIESIVGAFKPIGADDRSQARLADAAQHFEAMLLQEMLKPLRSGDDSLTGEHEDTNQDGSSSTLSSFGTEALATSISKSGGLGIARRVIQQVTLEKHQSSKEKQGRY